MYVYSYNDLSAFNSNNNNNNNINRTMLYYEI